MGRTVPSFRMAEAQEIFEWRRFRKALPKNDRKAFDEMLNSSRLYASASSAAVRTSRFEGMAMAIAFHHLKALAGCARGARGSSEEEEKEKEEEEDTRDPL